MSETRRQHMVEPARAMTSRWAFAAFVTLFSVAGSGQAAEVYRWTDAQGRVHYGDNPPEGTKAGAKPVEVQTAPINDPASAQDARRRATQAAQPASTPASAPAPVRALTTPGNVTPRTTVGDKSACEAAWKRFNDSHACFSPYRMQDGRIRPEGFEKCEDVPRPNSPC